MENIQGAGTVYKVEIFKTMKEDKEASTQFSMDYYKKEFVQYNVLEKENSLLKHIIKNLWINHKYSQEYSSYLLGLYSEDEFMEIAKSYAKTPNQNINKDELIYAFNEITSILNETLTSSDLSIMLDADCSNIDETIRQIKTENKNKLIGAPENVNVD